MKLRISSAAWSLVTCVMAALAPAQPSDIDRCNLVWQSPSHDASGSMPIGNGETGLNVWVEEGGDLVFYISRTDSWSEIDRLLKLGRVRVSLSPNPFAKGLPFRQELKLRDGRIDVTAGAKGAEARLQVFVNAAGSDIHVQGEFDAPTTVTATLESWRTEKKTFESDDELRSSWTMHSAPADVRKQVVWESPDVVEVDGPGVRWYHRNDHSVVPFTLEHQGLESIADQFPDTLTHRTFGGRMSGVAMSVDPARPGRIATSAPVRSVAVKITTHSAQTASIADWKNQLATLDRAAPEGDVAMASTAAWWREFWDRSWVFVSGDPAPAAMSADPPPKNSHPLRIGADSNGQNVFKGRMSALAMFDAPLTASQIDGGAGKGDGPAPVWTWPPTPGRPGAAPLHAVGAASETTAAGAGQALTFDGGHFEIAPDQVARLDRGFTLSATIVRGQSGAARIFDKMTAGAADGFIFDTHPGDSLRLIVGGRTLHATGVLKDDRPHQVAATYDAENGRIALYLDRKLVKESGAAFNDAAPASSLTRAYALQRWVAACGGRRVSGDRAFPIKFNGSIFTVEPVFTEGQPYNADWRKWGGCFWWQNTRLPYYPMLASGDFDLMDPLFRMFEGAVSGCRARAKLYHNASGIYFPETMTSFGTYGNGDYGWDRAGAKPSDVHCPWWQYAWQQGLELAQIMLDYGAYTGDDVFLRERAIPLANEALRYYDTRFGRDGKGVLRITPTQAVETYWNDVVNDAPSVGGLLSVCESLLALPKSLGTPEDRAFWARMQAATPPLPVWALPGGDTSTIAAAPAEAFKNHRSNVETAELYPLFPFRCYGLGRPNIEAAVNAYRARVDKSTVGWTQDGMFAALLGLTDEARANVLAKVGNSHRNFRFPAMWGPNFDWLPDQDHGSNLLTTVQLMLMQCDGKAIRLLPAWPREWDVSFKLRAPGKTTVEVVYRGGKIERLVVTPEARMADVIMPER